MTTHQLGHDAYRDDGEEAADQLKNLEGCDIHRFTIGTGEHEDRALAAVELPTGEGLGIELEADTASESVHTYPATEKENSWQVQPESVLRKTDQLTSWCPLEIVEAVQTDIMDPENARVALIIDGPAEKFAVDFYITDDGGANWFDVEL